MIYLDNAATTKPDSGCLQQAQTYLQEQFYNPSALYAEGYTLHKELTLARKNILECVTDEAAVDLIITSCGSEADNQALFCGVKRGNLVTTLGEHSAIFSTANELKARGVDVRFAKLNGDGSVNVDDLLSLVDEKTSLVSCIHVNNETGAVNDINAISAAVKAKNSKALFHADGVQAFGKIPFKLGKAVDLYSVSAHKIGAIKGVGALLKRKTVSIKPFVYGGGQENGLRSGTENVFGIKMFELASLKKYAAIGQNYQKVQGLKDLFVSLLDKSLFTVLSGEKSSPYILTLAMQGLRGETILHECDDRGLIIGTGSACSSNEKKRHSRVMVACGVDDGLLDGVLRISFCPENTEEEVKCATEILNTVVKNRKERMA
jgi:cysteine desulfurase